MPSILVVEHEGRYIERIQDALSSEGWQPRFVAGRPEALRAASSEEPALVLVNLDLPGAPELLHAFARRNGGPGSVALTPEHETVNHAAEVGADELLAKPFTDQELRLVVRRGLAAERSRGGAGTAAQDGDGDGGADEPVLTSQELFGDLLQEVEAEVHGEGGVLDAPAEREEGGEPTPAAEPSGERSRSHPEPPTPTEPEGRSAPARRSAPRSKRALDSDDPEIQRRLEQTLSGVLDERPRRRPADGGGERTDVEAGGEGQGAEAAQAAKAGESPRAAEPPRRRRPRTDADVDELLNLTLSSLEDSPLRRKRRAAADDEEPSRRAAGGAEKDRGDAGGESDQPERLFGDLDLSELEALAETGRKTRRRGGQSGHSEPPTASSPPAPPEATPPEPTGASGATQTAGSEGTAEAADEDPGEASWSDVAQALDSEGGAEVAPPPDFEPRGLAQPPVAEPQREEPAPAADDGHDHFGHYTLLERIAVGGMAEVWKARMRGVEGFQKTVAIKKILPQMTDNSEFVTMFIDEAKLAAQLNHPNITHIYDLGKIGDDYYIAMEYVEGSNLRSTLNQARLKGRPIPAALALVVAARLASALDYAHRKRDFDDRELELVHRDVSPQNVLLSYEGDIKLCDFGIVKAVTKASHTQMGALKGKLQYMSPEQAWGRQVDARSDIFSLGALLFEMLTGERLFAGDNEISVLEAVRECHVRSPRELNPWVSEATEEVVLTALAEAPDDRFASAGALQAELEGILRGLQPAPSQADLGDYLRELDAAEELSEEEREELDWGAASAPAGADAGGWDASAGPAPATGGDDEAPEDADLGFGFREPEGGRSAAGPDDLFAAPQAGEIPDLAPPGWDDDDAGEREIDLDPRSVDDPGPEEDRDEIDPGLTQRIPSLSPPPAPDATADEPATDEPGASKDVSDDRAADLASGATAEGSAPPAAWTGTGVGVEAAGEEDDGPVTPPPSAHPGDAAEPADTPLPEPGTAEAPSRPPTPSPSLAEATSGGEATFEEAVEPAEGREVELDEGEEYGRWLLVILIALLILASVIAYFYFGPGAGLPGGPPADEPPAVEGGAAAGEPDAAERSSPGAEDATAAPGGTSGADSPGSAPGDAGGEGAAGGTADGPEAAAGSAAAGGAGTDAAPGETDLSEMVEEQLARKERELRQRYEEEYARRERELQAELERLREQADEAPAEAGTGDGGEGGGAAGDGSGNGPEAGSGRSSGGAPRGVPAPGANGLSASAKHSILPSPGGDRDTAQRRTAPRPSPTNPSAAAPIP